MRARILYHDRCFDGACSAAVFSDFFRKRIDAGAELSWSGLFHRANQLFEEGSFDGDENAIVDFKYCASDKVTWWFDHHQSAFLCDADERHFRRDESGKKFYDPHYRSCTQFIADTTREKFGYDSEPMAELIHWADIIDGALYESAEAAVMMAEAAMKITLVFEASEENLTSRVIPLMMSESLEEIMSRTEMKAVFEPLFQKHLGSIEVIKKRARDENGVVFFDLGDTDMAGYNKFIPYYLHPDSIYTVSVLDAGFRTKVSVGSNPWATSEPSHNLATLCERYGGGGHARVGAISYGPKELERARETAREIVAELSS
jgi:hypothetical protein